MTVGPNSYVPDFIAACGGINVFSERHGRYPMSDLGEVARRVPEIILLPDEPYPFTTKHFDELTEYPYVPAVVNSRIYLLDGKHLGCYGPRIAGSLRYVQKLMWGDPASTGTSGAAAGA